MVSQIGGNKLFLSLMVILKRYNPMNKTKAPWHYLFLLIIAGEAVFILPFVLSRIFRPTVLEVFALDNVQLGYCFSIYGLVALLSYFFGGPLADKFAPCKLIAVALWLTSLGGLVYATFPDYVLLKILYGYWGFTTIFLFWAPMIKATRIWGGPTSQGKAFGFLDGGRGLVGALFGTLGVLIFARLIPSASLTTSLAESRAAFRMVIITTSGIVAVIGVLVWLFMKMDGKTNKEVVLEKITLSQVKEVLRLPAVLLLMAIISCAYVGYKISDIFSLYAQDVMLYDQVQAAQIGTFLLFVRPAIGVLIGLLADRSQTTFWLFVGFIVSFVGAVLLATGIISASTPALFFISIMIVATGVYATRSLYFAVMESGQIPLVLTGTAVGLISLVAYTPDIFAGPVIGYLLERSRGAAGHQHVFWMLALFSITGGIAAWYYHKLYRKN